MPYTEADVDAMIEIWERSCSGRRCIPPAGRTEPQDRRGILRQTGFCRRGKGKRRSSRAVHPAPQQRGQMRSPRQRQLCRFFENAWHEDRRGTGAPLAGKGKGAGLTAF